MNDNLEQPGIPTVSDEPYAVERARLLLAFGEKLRAERERRNLSQEALAEIANIHRTQLGALELGRREPHLAMLLILADGLGISPIALLEGLFVPRARKAPTHSKRRCIRMKSQGLRELFFGVAEGACSRLEGALRRHSDRTAPGGVCIWSIRPFLLRRGRVVAQGDQRRRLGSRRVLGSGMICCGAGD